MTGKAPCGCPMILGFGKFFVPTCETEVGPVEGCRKTSSTTPPPHGVSSGTKDSE
jgi:hypothetical protein